MTGQFVFIPDATQPGKQVSFAISNDQLQAAASFVRDHSAQYEGIGHLLASNLQSGLFSQLASMYPNPTITALQAQLNAIQQQVAALLAASNPPPTATADPVVVQPF